MNKKTPYPAYYYASMQNVTFGQMKATKSLPQVDISAIQQWMDKQNIYGIVEGYPWYHQKLMHIPSKPYILFAKGSLAVLNKPMIAVVWPRKISEYGKQIVHHLFKQLCCYELVTVSGMATWVDMLCHELSVQYGIPTVAVLGGWFWPFLRWKKRELMARIVDSGWLILSEYKHWFVPTNRSFPQRNRIIAGIADRIFLPEAAHESGSLITAEYARRMQKPVFAPMNSIFAENSKGTNAYIEQWYIKPLSSLVWFLDDFAPQSWNSMISSPIQLSDEEKIIMKLFNEYESMDVNTLYEKIWWDIHNALLQLTTLEMNWCIYEISPGVYTKKVCIDL